MAKAKRDKVTQKEFLFIPSKKEVFLSDPHRPQDLGSLLVDVLQITPRAKKWLRAHQITDLAQLAAAERMKLISRQCLDNQVRKELHRELSHYWDGKKFNYILALNFLDRGIKKVLSQQKFRMTPLKHLSLSPYLQEVLQKKKIQTIGQLLLQPELKWRNPRMLGNILVNEILIAISTFLVKCQKK